MNVALIVESIQSISSSFFVEHLGWVLVHSLWQFSLVALAAGILVQAMQRCASDTRYWILVGGLGLLVACPVATWQFVSIEASDSIENQSVSTPTIPTIARVDSIIAGKNVATRADESKLRALGEGHNPVVSRLLVENRSGPQPDLLLPAPPLGRSSHPLAPLHQSAQPVQEVIRLWMPRMVFGWFAGVLLCSLRPILGWRMLRRLRRVGIELVSSDIQQTLSRVSLILGMRRVVGVLQSSVVKVPVVVGYLQPIILLPVSLATSIPPSQLEAILAHELAHVRRHDFVLNLMQTLIETIFFYHPAMWWLSHRIRIEREHCCDDLVVSLLGIQVEYGRALLAVAECTKLKSALVMSAADGSLRTRVHRILGLNANSATNSLWSIVCLLACFVLIVLSMSIPARHGMAEIIPETSVTEKENLAVRKKEAPKSHTREARFSAADTAKWLGELKSDSSQRQVQATVEIVERLADNPTGKIDVPLINSLTALLSSDEMVANGRMTQRVGDWIKAPLVKIGRFAVLPLIETTNEGDAKSRKRAAECLGEISTVGPRGIDALISLFEHHDREVSGAAASSLRRMASEPTLIPKLLEACENGNLQRQCYAISVLGKMQDERVDATMVNALNSSEPELQRWAAYAVSETPRPKLVPEIIALLKTADQQLRSTLESALYRCGTQNPDPVLKGTADEDERIRAACIRVFSNAWNENAPQIAAAIVARLDDKDSIVLSTVFNVVENNSYRFEREAVVQPLIGGLTHEDSSVRAAAASALRAFAERWPFDRRPVTPLLKTLEDPQPDVVIGAIRALAEFRELKAVPQLVRLAKSDEKSSERIRNFATEALGVLGGHDVLDVLRKNLEKKEPQAIEALGKLHDRESIPQFIEFLKDNDDAVRTAAANALAQNPDHRAVEPLIATLDRIVNSVNSGRSPNFTATVIAGALVQIGEPEAIAAVIDRIDNVEPYFFQSVSEEALASLSPMMDLNVSSNPFSFKLREAGVIALPELAKGLASPKTRTRQVCAWVVHNLGIFDSFEPADVDAIRPALLTALRDPDPVVRYCALKAMSLLRIQEAEPIFLDLLEAPLPKDSATNSSGGYPPSIAKNHASPAIQIQTEAIRCLFSLKTDAARDALLRALSNPEPAIRSAAAGHLGAFPSEFTVGPLIQALSDSGACAEAARVLGHVGDPRAVTPLIEILTTHADLSVQANAAQSLGLLGATDAKPLLREVLSRIPAVESNSDKFAIQCAAAISLCQLQDDAGANRIQELLGSDDRSTRMKAAEQLNMAKYFSGWRPPARLSFEPLRRVMRRFAEHANETQTRSSLLEALSGQLDETTVEFLKSRARDPQEPISWTAWRILVSPNPAAYESELMELIVTTEDRVRIEVVGFIGQIPTHSATDRLLSLTSDPNAEFRVAVVNALAKHRSEKVDERLFELSKEDPSQHVRARVSKILTSRLAAEIDR